ncbi:Phytanoyl-CoA dioxygenase domain-containing protein 1 [Glaciecola pallidula DSM 14239 = ACAM 615]|uniref:Phytanoyl-CoA dioxygenase domain-containing protein 1 n=2 Tax=Brumicola TaxID=3160924 RepID=K7A429_9ALTE|nr:Phytanoyl-CoA dioxygenase domain-containing protein 1 [Glaciecola pallidula DSM 14239 = ACAM 615]
MRKVTMLSNKQKQRFEQQGYLVLDELFNQQQINTLKAAAGKIVDDFDPQSTRSVFSTQTESNKNRDDYFLDSDDKIRCFFEEDAFSLDGELQQTKALSINKIGHALHVLSPEFAAFSQAKIIAQIAEDLGVVAPEIRQSMYIFKQPKIGGVIRWHQDATYFFTTPQSVVTFWFAIEDANIENGCLQVDKQGADFVLKEQFKRYADNTTELLALENVDWPTQDRALPLEVKAGSLVVFNGALPHFSEANRSNKSRHAFTLHLTSAQAKYDELNWLRAKPVRIHS